MKTTVYILLFTCMGALCSSILQSCTKKIEDTDYDCKDTDQYYNFTSDEKARVGYSGYDTLTFVSNAGDTVHCIGGGKIPFTVVERENYANPACAGNGIYKHYEAYKIVYADSTKKLNIELGHYQKIIFPYGFKPSYDLNIVRVSVKNIQFYVYDTEISNPIFDSYVGNINVNGIQYSGVSKVLKNYTDSSCSALMNKDIGIIQLTLKPTETWTLLK